MKTLGVVGGIGPESTIEYYRAIVDAYRGRHGDGENPSLVINSIDLNRLLGLVEAGQLEVLTAYLVDEVERLVRAGASLGLLAANTPHVVFDEVAHRSAIPMLSIVEATCEEAKVRGLTRLGLFGTRFTMQGHFYQDVFSRHGMNIVAPANDEQDYIHEKYTAELLRGIFLPGTREGLLGIVERLKDRDGMDGIILGGTELPLLLRGDTGLGVPVLDTTQIHATAAVNRLWG